MSFFRRLTITYLALLFLTLIGFGQRNLQLTLTLLWLVYISISLAVRHSRQGTGSGFPMGLSPTGLSPTGLSPTGLSPTGSTLGSLQLGPSTSLAGRLSRFDLETSPREAPVSLQGSLLYPPHSLSRTVLTGVTVAQMPALLASAVSFWAVIHHHDNQWANGVLEIWVSPFLSLWERLPPRSIHGLSSVYVMACSTPWLLVAALCLYTWLLERHNR